MMSTFLFATASEANAASSSGDPELNSATPLGVCAERADDENIGAWLCFGPYLYKADSNGDLSLVDIVEPESSDISGPTAPESTVPEPTTPQPTAPGSTVPGSPDLPPSPSANVRNADAIRPAAWFRAKDTFRQTSSATTLLAPIEKSHFIAADFYDTWCENGSICRRVRTDYTAETKGNAAYGNQSGVVGTFDIILKTNINGSSARFTGIFDWDSGPKATFSNTRHNLVRTRDSSIRWWRYVDGENGNGAFAISSSDTRDTGPLLHASPQRNSYQYYGRISGSFDTSKTPKMNFANLNGNKVTCHGSSGCIMDD